MRLGDYIFPEYFRTISTGIKTKFNKGKIAGEHGIVLPTGYYEPELITIGGTIVGKNRQEVEGIFNRMMQNVTNGAQDLCLGSLDVVENGRFDSWDTAYYSTGPTRWNKSNATVSQKSTNEDFYNFGPYTALMKTTLSTGYIQQVISPDDFDGTKVRGIFWVRNANPSGGTYDATFRVFDGSGNADVIESIGTGEQKRVSVDFDSTGSQLYCRMYPCATASGKAIYVDRIALIQRADSDEPEPGVYRDVQYAGHSLRYSPDDPDRMWEVELRFQAPKPFIYEYTDYSLNSGGCHSFPHSMKYHLTGNVSVNPKFTLEASTLSGAEEIVITNSADGNSITLTDRSSGLSTGTYIIDMDAKTITLNGSDALNLWEDGIFFELDRLSSASTVTIDTDASSAYMNITFEHANAWEE